MSSSAPLWRAHFWTRSQVCTVCRAFETARSMRCKPSVPQQTLQLHGNHSGCELDTGWHRNAFTRPHYTTSLADTASRRDAIMITEPVSKQVPDFSPASHIGV